MYNLSANIIVFFKYSTYPGKIRKNFKKKLYLTKNQ